MQGAGNAMNETRMLLSNSTPGGGRARTALMRSAALAAILAIGLTLGACKKISEVSASLGDITGSTGSASVTVPPDQLGLHRFNTDWGARYEKNPDDKRIVMNYALGLRAAQRYDQAIAILQKAAIKYPNDMELLASYGKALADAGRFQEAAQVLEKAQIPERPNWSVLSTQGSVADQMGNHVLAQQYYVEALKVAPGEPSVLSNLGLSHALNKQLAEGERVLRQASLHPRADRRVRQNLALVLALQGKFAEAENVLQKDLSPADATANVASIRSMIAQSNTWRDIQTLDRPAPAAAPRRRQPASGAPTQG